MTNDIAMALIDAGCVTFQREEPFRLPSGWASPVYMDCRRLISFPAIRRRVVDGLVDIVNQEGGRDRIDCVVGAEASGIALAAWVADRIDLPLHYVRKKALGARQVEGDVVAGQRVLLIDDLVAAGHSKVRFIGALRDAGLEVSQLAVVFDYGTFDAAARVSAMGVGMTALASWRDVLDTGRLSAADHAALERFIAAPSAWSAAHGGIHGESAVA